MDWEPTKIGALAPLTEKERQRLRDAGGCFKCRQKGHLARDCTTPTAPRRSTTSASASTSRRPSAPAPTRRTRRQPEPDSEEGDDEEEEDSEEETPAPAPAPRRRSTRTAKAKPKKAVTFEDSESSGNEYL
jgi:septal ring-binding cell division protein DamX